MDQKITIEEKYSRYWVQITTALVAGAVLFFIAYSTINDVLWEGILRLISFGLLAASVFSGLKVMQGKITIKIEVEEDNLVLSYFKNERKISRDIFELTNIGKIIFVKHNTFLGQTLPFEDLNVRFIPADSDRPLNLVEVNGRALALSKVEAEKLSEFIKMQVPDITILEDEKD